MDRFTGLLGLVVVMAVAYLFSSNRRAIQPRSRVNWGSRTPVCRPTPAP